MNQLRKPLFTLLMLLILAAEPVALAENEYISEAGEHFVYEVEDGHAILTEYWITPGRENPAEIRVPASLDGYPLEEIGWCAFQNYEAIEYQGEHFFPYEAKNVKCIILPEGVKTLRDGAFGCCHDVPSISLPSTLSKIETGLTFEHLSAEILLPNGNPYYTIENGFLIDQRTDSLLYCNPSAHENSLPPVARIEQDALENYACYQSVLTFPDTVTYIGSRNAYDLIYLESIIVPPNVIELDDRALYCNSATTIVLNEGLKRIGAYALAETEVESLVVPASVEWIGYNAFGWLEPEKVTVLNPNCVWETEEQYHERIGY